MKNPAGGSLRREILVWYLLVLIVALGLFASAAYFLLSRALNTAEEESLRQTAQAVENVAVPSRIPRIETAEEFVTFQNPNGQPVRSLRRQTVLATGEIFTVAVTPAGDVEGRALRSFLLISLLLIPLTAAAAALGGRILLERLLDPLRQLVETTREIGIGGLSRRVPEPETPTDLHDLARSVNGMLMRLERTVDALRRFTADASHELRTPLTSIQGSVQVALSRDRTAEELRETLADVNEETEWMLHLVDGLLTLARGEEGQKVVVREPVEITALLEDVVEMGEMLAAGTEVRVTLESSEPFVVAGQAGQLRQIFLNLVSNAVKFTTSGAVTVTARRTVDNNHQNWVEVRVSDTGVGIAPEELSRVFDRFYRGDAARGRSGGTGLGLAIARLLAELHGGGIEVQSRLGYGSQFTIRLPEWDAGDAIAAAEQQARIESKADRAGRGGQPG
ncbi:MAG: HAMP domain-containing protein [Gemmatimonadota bacterium]|jgi:heavy metal sensor kinase|nr:HAMP domain-containing protein [Gemmatimonadota bacterium]